jgi:hypothetical protein
MNRAKIDTLRHPNSLSNRNFHNTNYPFSVELENTEFSSTNKKMHGRDTHCDKVARVTKICSDRGPFTNHMTGTAANKPFFYKFGTFSSSSLYNLPKISII